MSTDEQRSEPDDRSPKTGEPRGEQKPVDETPDHSAVARTPAEQGVEEPAEQPSPTASEVAPGTAYPASPSPTVDETHLAVPAQRTDDPFSEVDGGKPDEGEATTTAFPTPEEDAALRDERARRFGRPSTEGGEATPAAEEEPTSRVPLGAAGAGTAAGVGAAGAAGTSRSGSDGSGATRTMPATTTTTEGDDDPFSEFDEGPASRAASHWWSILISLVFLPVAWYLIADGGERMNFNLTNGGPFNWAGPAELAGGALCLFVVLLAARWSSVGVILTGIIGAAAGIAFIVFNAEAMDLIAEYQGTLVQGLEQLGQNIVDHLLADARSGRLAIYGIALIMVGVVSHGARRQGRREERRKAAIGA